MLLSAASTTSASDLVPFAISASGGSAHAPGKKSGRKPTCSATAAIESTSSRLYGDLRTINNGMAGSALGSSSTII